MKTRPLVIIPEVLGVSFLRKRLMGAPCLYGWGDFTGGSELHRCTIATASESADCFTPAP